MPKKSYWSSGQYNVECQECGFRYKSTQVTRRWDGIYVCEFCYEPRHPQELIRNIPEQNKMPFTSPEVDVFISDYSCTMSGRQAIPEYAVAGCAVAGRDTRIRGYVCDLRNSQAIPGYAVPGCALTARDNNIR